MNPESKFRRAVESHDLDEIMGQFADDAVLHSPITFQAFEGREAIRMLLGIIIEVFEDFQYTDELTNADGTRVLVFRARVGRRDAEGIDLLRYDDAGRVRDLTVFVRPRSALEALLERVGPRLAAALAGTAPASE